MVVGLAVVLLVLVVAELVSPAEMATEAQEAAD